MKEPKAYGVGTMLRAAGWMLVGGVGLTAALFAYSAWQLGDRTLSAIAQVFHAPPPVPKVDVQSVVVQQIHEASELTTAVFTMQAVVPTSQDAAIGAWTIGTTKLLYIAYGDVQAGVDLSTIAPGNVQVSDSRIHIQLPPPKILSSRIDVNRSSVYDYNRGFLSLGPDTAPQLQTLAQQKALKSVIEAACNDGLLQRANDRATLVITQLLSAGGYRNVAVETQPVPPDRCIVSAK